MKRIIYIILLMFMTFSVNAIDTTNITFYYTLDDVDVTGAVIIDKSGNNNGTANAQANTSGTGIFNQGRSFDGVDDDIDSGTGLSSSQKYSMGCWFKESSISVIQAVILNTGGGNEVGIVASASPSEISFKSDGITSDSGVSRSAGSWYHVVQTYDGVNVRGYVNGSNTNTFADAGYVASGNTRIGQHVDNLWEMTGVIDECFMYHDRVLTSQEINDTRDSQFPHDFFSPAIISNVSSSTSSLINNYSLTTLSGSLTNMSYILNGGSLISILNDTNSTSVIITGVSGTNNISWFSEDGLIPTWTNETFTVDVTAPIINNTLLSEFSNPNRSFVVSDFVNATDDVGVTTCFISFNNTQTANCTDSNFTFNLAGNFTYNITAGDGAGNVNISSGNIIYVNPIQYFRFNDSIRNIIITNYSLGDFDVNSSYLSFSLFDLDLGNTILNFSKLGYVETEITLNLNLTSAFNTSYDIVPSNLFFTVYDFHTLSTLSNWTLTILQNGTELNESNVTSTYQLLYNSTFQGDLEFVFQKSGYIPSHYIIDFSSGSTATENIYLLNSSSNTLMPITIKDILGANHIEGASVNLYGIQENDEYFIDEQTTDFAGKVYFTLHDDYLYKLIVTKNGYLTTNFEISPLESSYTFFIPEDQTTLNYIYAGFNYNIDLFNQNNISYLRARYTDEDSLINKVTLNSHTLYVNGTNQSLISSTDTLLISLPSNATFINAHLEVIRNGTTYNFYAQFLNESFIINGSVSLGATEFVPDTEDKTLIVLIVSLSAIFLGAIFYGQIGGFGAGIISFLSLWYLGLMSIYLAMPLVLFMLLMFGFFRGGDV